MKHYVYLDLESVARQIIPEFDFQFPGVPIEERYSSEFLKNCIIREDNALPQINQVYDSKNDSFTNISMDAMFGNINNMKASKIDEMRILCEYKIINEFYSSCKGESARYDCEVYDQTNIQGAVLTSMLVLNGLANETLMYKNSNQLVCEDYTPQEMIQLGIDLKKHVEGTIHRFDLLRQYIMSEDRTEEELNLLTWDSEI